MAFGKEIKRLRNGSNVSAEKLAKLIGIDAERLRKWEQRDFSPKDEDLIKIESFFGMPIKNLEKLDSIKKFLIVPRETNNNLDKQKNPDEISGLKQELFEAYKREAELNRKLANTNLDDLIKIVEANRALLIRLDKLFPPGLELDKNAFYSVKEGLKDDKNAG